jgi:PBP1b-binding outer membrane lipoprotein LpoB
MKKILSVLMMSIIVLSGCTNSYSLTDQTGISSKLKTVSTKEPKAMIELSNDIAKPVPAHNEDVVWSHKEIRNLHKLDQFMENVNNKVKDEINVRTSSKEGEAIVKNLKYDGEVIQVTVNDVQKKYDRLLIEKRFSEHYNGTFIEYWVSQNNDESKKELILQIHPDLGAMAAHN